MRNPLAFFGSLGASAALVGAIAVSLLTLSAVVALHGWPGLGEEADARQALVVDGAVTPPTPATPRGAERSGGARRDSVVLRAPAARPRRGARVRSRPRGGPRLTVRRGDDLAGRQPDISSTPPIRDSSVGQSAPQRRGLAPTAALPRPVGDAVRELGDDLSSGARDGGTATGEVAPPLSPVVRPTVQELTELIVALLRNSSLVVGSALDGLAPR